MEQIETYKQCSVHNDSHIDVCLESEKGEISMEQNTKHVARKIQIDRQVENKTYAHDTSPRLQTKSYSEVGNPMCYYDMKTITGNNAHLEGTLFTNARVLQLSQDLKL